MRVEALPRPAQSYHANWAAFEPGEDGVTLCFGQRAGNQLMSRLDVSIGFDEFNNLIDGNPDFMVAAFTGVSAPDIRSGPVADPIPVGGKYLLEAATMVVMAVFNASAEMVFYRVSPRDLNILLGSHPGRPDDPVPVVAVTMSRRLLCGLLDEMKAFRGTKVAPLLVGGGL